MQTKFDQRMNEYTELAMAGREADARKVRDSLNPVREASKAFVQQTSLKRSRNTGRS